MAAFLRRGLSLWEAGGRHPGQAEQRGSDQNLFSLTTARLWRGGWLLWYAKHQTAIFSYSPSIRMLDIVTVLQAKKIFSLTGKNIFCLQDRAGATQPGRSRGREAEEVAESQGAGAALCWGVTLTSLCRIRVDIECHVRVSPSAKRGAGGHDGGGGGAGRHHRGGGHRDHRHGRVPAQQVIIIIIIIIIIITLMTRSASITPSGAVSTTSSARRRRREQDKKSAATVGSWHYNTILWICQYVRIMSPYVWWSRCWSRLAQWPSWCWPPPSSPPPSSSPPP